MFRLVNSLLVIIWLVNHACVAAEQVHVAVASNFTATLKRLIPVIEQQADIKVIVSSASSGKLYAQINSGAPFDVFLSADAQRPMLLEQHQRIIPGSRFTYAIGRLAVWHPKLESEQFNWPLLVKNPKHKLAIGNPLTVPYGLAAQQTLEGLELWQQAQGQLLRGENISQTLQFALAGGARFAFVAESQMLALAERRYTIVPDNLYSAVEQQAVQLSNKASAQRFLIQLQSASVANLIRQSGYSTP